MGATKKAAKVLLVLAGCVALSNGQTTTNTASTVVAPEEPTTKATRPTVAPIAPSTKKSTGSTPSSDTSAPNPEESIEDIVYTGPLPQDCVSPDVKYTSEVLTDFIPVYREARQCQQACQAHGECYFWTWHEGKAGALQSIPEAGEEIELFVPEYSYAESQRRALGFADHTPVSKASPRMRSLQTKRPTADDVLAAPPAGACFLFGPYVKTSIAEMHISGPRTCADECSALYSANCKYSRCCSRATATCVSKDSFFSQCRLPTDACPGRGWNCYNVSSTPLGCLEYDTEYAPDVFGNDLEEILDVPTEHHCQELCKNHAKCSYWSYNPWYKHMCLLKKKNRPKRASKGIISGTKECAGFSQPETLYYLEEAPEYSTFYALLQKAGLVSYVEEKTSKATNGTGGGITLLVPTNRAFEALPTTVERKLKSSDSLLKKLMLYHMIDKPVWIERTIGDKTFTAIKSASGDDIELSRRASAGGNLRINDADVLIMDLRTRDGMLNLITDVLIPPSLADEADGSLDSLDGKVSGQGVASLLENEEAAIDTDVAAPPKKQATKTPAAKTTPAATTTSAPTTAKKTVTARKTVAPTTTTTTDAPPKTTSRRPVIDDDASTIMDTVSIADPTANPEGAMPTTGLGSTPSTDDKTSVETSDRKVPGVQENDNVQASDNGAAMGDNGAAMGDRGIDMEDDEIMEAENTGVLGMGLWLDILLLILLLALVGAAAAAAFMWNKKKQAAKSLESEVAQANSTNARVEYGSR